MLRADPAERSTGIARRGRAFFDISYRRKKVLQFNVTSIDFFQNISIEENGKTVEYPVQFLTAFSKLKVQYANKIVWLFCFSPKRYIGNTYNLLSIL